MVWLLIQNFRIEKKVELFGNFKKLNICHIIIGAHINKIKI